MSTEYPSAYWELKEKEASLPWGGVCVNALWVVIEGVGLRSTGAVLNYLRSHVTSVIGNFH